MEEIETGTKGSAASDRMKEAWVVRKARAAETRTNQSRVAQERPPMTIQGGRRFCVPQALMDSDPDHEYAFIVSHAGGQEERESFERNIEEREFMPVSPSESPYLSRRTYSSPFARPQDDLYKVAGQVLVKRPIEVAQEEKHMIAKINENQESAMHLVEEKDPRKPRAFVIEN